MRFDAPHFRPSQVPLRRFYALFELPAGLCNMPSSIFAIGVRDAAWVSRPYGYNHSRQRLDGIRDLGVEGGVSIGVGKRKPCNLRHFSRICVSLSRQVSWSSETISGHRMVSVNDPQASVAGSHSAAAPLSDASLVLVDAARLPSGALQDGIAVIVASL